jgi:hypothetical protein
VSIGVFTDKTQTPGLDEVWPIIGARRMAWEALAGYMARTFGGQADWKFYGKNYGWALSFRKGSRALLALYPGQAGFTAQLIVGPGQLEKALSLPLGEHVRRILEEAHPYPEGRWLFIPVETDQDVQDIQQLLATKSRPVARR